MQFLKKAHAGYELALSACEEADTSTAEASSSAEAQHEEHFLRLAKYGHFEEVVNLLRQSPSLMSVHSPSGYTVLHQAGFFGVSSDMVAELVRAGGDLSREALRAQQKDGLTPAEYAEHKGHSETAAALHLQDSGGALDLHGVQARGEHRVICIGDVHGNAEPMASLWSRLQSALGEEELGAATVVFLGDYCDRGPQTREALDFMIDLRQRRAVDKTFFIAGNHDLGMAAFLGCLPTGLPHPDLDGTRRPEFRGGFWKGAVPGGMHYQGRRWGGSGIYEAASTFASYGVDWDPRSADLHDRLREAVPAAHKQFLSSLLWVYEQAVPWMPGRVICVHAGLVADSPAEAQLAALRRRDLSAPVLHDRGDPGRIAAFSARASVLGMHPDLEARSLLVSGHHGSFYMEGDRIVNDKSGGHASKARPLEAIVLPERRVIGAFEEDCSLQEIHPMASRDSKSSRGREAALPDRMSAGGRSVPFRLPERAPERVPRGESV